MSEKPSYVTNSYKQALSLIKWDNFSFENFLLVIFDLNSILYSIIKNINDENTEDLEVLTYAKKVILSLINKISSKEYVLLCESETGVLKKEIQRERISRFFEGKSTIHHEKIHNLNKLFLLKYGKELKNLLKICLIHSDSDEFCAMALSKLRLYQSRLSSKFLIVTEDLDFFLFDPTCVLLKPLSSKCLTMNSILKQLNLTTHEQFLNMAILCGTDYNKGLNGYGIKRSINVAKQGLLRQQELEYVNRFKEFFTKYLPSTKR